MRSKFDTILQFFQIQFPDYVLHEDLQITVKCPFCTDYNKQKFKFSFNAQKQIFHCWVCQTKGIGFIRFINKLKQVRGIYGNISQYISKFKSAQNFKPNIPQHDKDDQNIWQYKYKNVLQLNESFNKNLILSYIKKRGFNQLDIAKYNISIITNSVKYKNRIVIPSYNDRLQLSYLVARSYISNINPKYLNSRINKNRLIFFQYLINWKLPIILTQGVFDAMTIDSQAIPLLGKDLSPRLRQVILMQKIKQIYIAFDGDAYRQAIKLAYKLVSLNVKHIHILRFENNQDCNSVGKQRVWKLINQSKPLHVQQILQLYKGGR